MFFDYLNGLFINVPLIMMASLLVARCQNMMSHSNGFLFHLKCVICGAKIKVNVFLFAAYSHTSKIFALNTPPQTCFVPLCKLPNVFVFSFSSQTRCDFHQERSN